ncbi:unnamed protein product [Amaranthus hypochondriacus]
MKQLDIGYNSLRLSEGEKKVKMFVTLLRIIVFLATLVATIVMALNKETKTLVVATIGTSSIKATIAAKFQHTPANIFFVVGNGLAALHSLLALLAQFFGKKLDPKGVRFMIISILDIIILAILAASTSSAAFMAELAKHGNNHAQWNKICDKFESFCRHGAGAILASFIGLLVLLILLLISTFKHYQIVNKTNGSLEI